ncbi:dTDP-4-dehydrorhamnose reductase [Thermosinus carboxydivorans Nor1]|uniref:dTDP-4-dehydrorhamnose reductase n=1 Tax=Thermosinus carboxydivorans Nor1 TaxID=401526 RepID=A1HMC7_9FIRM|nr:dTDP-4-dehydrorhamnose reductase [Thermosinus carboxydivorans]EAX48971.1 dTDP-4-dehydrorhamnose reductase [Thermosinus carboxydivorans Nor1]
MQKILVTGANGQLGRALQRQFCEKYELVLCDLPELDITNFKACRDAVRTYGPDIVINAAAYTNVERAEDEPDAAYAVNAIGAHNLALVCREANVKLIHISTDYVFDGARGTPYSEYDAPNPLSVYGKSKLLGEQLIRDTGGWYFIVRTAWLYGDGHNFVRTMLRLAGERPEIAVVADQYGTPTYTVDLAALLEQIMHTEYYGIYHATNAGNCTWYEFACKIFEYADKKVAVRPITTDEYPTKAKRPRYSVLDNHMLRLRGFDIMRPWEEALKDYIANDCK